MSDTPVVPTVPTEHDEIAADRKVLTASARAVADAIETMARVVLANLAHKAADEWECWPDIGEEDWMRVVDVISRLAPLPVSGEMIAAYALLEARADPNV